MKSSTNSVSIARNTIFLYFRMMITMLISLYTSRVVLQILGIDDFGLYAVVGGVVGLFSFINNALSTSSSRFLTFELGKNKSTKLRQTFNTLLNIHLLITIVVALLSETVGLWFVYNKLAIPAGRLDAAVWVYHLSVLSAVVTIAQVPYNAAIISHEKMNVFAYVSIVDVSLKLGIVYLLKIGSFDKLVLYAGLVCLVTIIIALFYYYYCKTRFPETQYQFVFDKDMLRSVGGFSGWSLFGSLTYALKSHGTNIITSMFFGPGVVTARAISVQVNMTAMQFVQNFRMAVNPQIIKKYAAEDYEGSKSLLLDSTKFSFYLMLLLGLPIILLSESLLQLWLGQVPEYSVIFLKLIIIQSLFQVFDSSFLTALHAKGRLRENALISPLIAAIRFLTVYFLFRADFSPVVLSYAGIVSFAIVGLIIKPVLLNWIVGYSYRDIICVFVSCLKVSLVSIPIPIFVNNLFENTIANFIIVCATSIVCVLTAVFYIGISAEVRNKVLVFAKVRFFKH